MVELAREQGRRGVQGRRYNLRWRLLHGGDGDGDGDESWGGGVRVDVALKAAANASSLLCLLQRLAQPRAAAEVRVAIVVWFGLVFVGFV